MERADPVLVEAGVDVGRVGEQQLDAGGVVAHGGAEERRRQVLVVEHVHLQSGTTKLACIVLSCPDKLIERCIRSRSRVKVPSGREDLKSAIISKSTDVTAGVLVCICLK